MINQQYSVELTEIIQNTFHKPENSSKDSDNVFTKYEIPNENLKNVCIFLRICFSFLVTD